MATLDRGVWIDGGDPAYHVLEEELVSLVLFDVRDPRLTAAYLRDVLTKIPRVGLFVCSQGEGWPSSDSTAPRAWADYAYREIQRVADSLGPQGGQIRACLNCETHEVAWILAMLKRWRSHSPRRGTVWTMEGNQAEPFIPHAAELRERSIDVGPQAYLGAMRPQDRIESGHEVSAWGKIVGVDRVVPFLDAAALGHWWEGVAFTQGRLIGARA